MSVIAAIRDANNPYVRVPPADEIHSNMFMIQVNTSKITPTELLDKFSTVSYSFNIFFDNSIQWRFFPESCLGIRTLRKDKQTIKENWIFESNIFSRNFFSWENLFEINTRQTLWVCILFSHNLNHYVQVFPVLIFWIIKFKIFRKLLLTTYFKFCSLHNCNSQVYEEEENPVIIKAFAFTVDSIRFVLCCNNATEDVEDAIEKIRLVISKIK